MSVLSSDAVCFLNKRDNASFSPPTIGYTRLFSVTMSSELIKCNLIIDNCLRKYLPYYFFFYLFGGYKKVGYNNFLVAYT